MNKAMLFATFAATLSACALPTYEPFTEYANQVAANPTNAIDLCSNGLAAPSGELWGSLNYNGKGAASGTETNGIDILVTNYLASPFTATALANLLPATFPGFPASGQAITMMAVNPAQPIIGTTIVGNSAVLIFANDVTRPASGTKTLYLSYLFAVAQQGQLGTGNDGRYLAFLAASNLYEPSTITFPMDGEKVQVAMTSQFPYQPEVSLKVAMSQPAAMKLRIRVPAWAASSMAILVNGDLAMSGAPGTYAVLDRTWKDGDTVSFVLPMELHFTEYRGASQIPDHTRYALEYGPILMAAIGPLDKQIPVKLEGNAGRPQDWIKPIAGQPLHWMIDGDPNHSFIPYWKITGESYTCFPVIDSPL